MVAAWAAVESQPVRHTNGDRVFDAVGRVIAHRAHDSHRAAESDVDACFVDPNSDFGTDFADTESVRLA